VGALRWAIAFPFVLTSVGANAQRTPKTLADFLKEMKWNAGKSGALIALQPDQVLASPNKQGVLAFRRKLVRIGDLSVVAPESMVLIDDSFGRAMARLEIGDGG